jgi:ABC-type lipoprotein release transport system permease subunit
MKLLPWDYGVRNLGRRPLRTVLTTVGLMLVVFLLMLVLSFQRGMEVSLAQSGDPQIVLLHNINAAENIENSSISDEVTALARTEFARQLVTIRGSPAVSPELTIATRVGEAAEGQLQQLGVLRGVDWQRVFQVRRQVFVTQGQVPERDEVLVGRLTATKLGVAPDSLAVGKSLVIEGKPWRISGHFAAPGTLLEAEIWVPLDDLKVALKRPNDISLLAMRFDAEGDPVKQMGLVEYFCRNRRPDLELMGSRETDYYASLQKHYGPMRALSWLLVALVGIAGGCGAVNTMYAAVAGRVREFAVLQSLGFPRTSIAMSLIQESVLLSASATLLASGVALLLLQGVAVRFTMGAFTLQLDRPVVLLGGMLGITLGVIGAIPPIRRAFRLEIQEALKAV